MKAPNSKFQAPGFEAPQTDGVIQFIQAVGGFRPPDTLEERMRAMQVISRLLISQRTSTIGGSGGCGSVAKRFGNMNVIAARDFGLTHSQAEVCRARATDELAQTRRMAA